MYVKRIYARLCISTLAIGIILVVIPGLFPTYVNYGEVFIIGGGILMLTSLAMKWILLRCPNCNKGGMSPQWSANGTYHCPYCGEKVYWK